MPTATMPMPATKKGVTQSIHVSKFVVGQTVWFCTMELSIVSASSSIIEED